jgi:hypothetical protein
MPLMRYFVLVFLLVAASARPQVMQNTNYQHELEHARALLAGTTPTDAPHHVHYDLKFYDRNGHEGTATYDVYRDPIMYERTEIKADDYQFTQISDVRNHTVWQQYTGDKPLKVAGFEQAVQMPMAAINRLAREPERVGNMELQAFEKMPLLCANDHAGTAVCFNPLIHLFSFAQMFNQTVMYDNWLPVGSHTVPGTVRIYEDKKLLLQATATVEMVKKFPPHLMEIPQTPSQPDPVSRHKIVQREEMELTQARFGDVAMRLSVDEKGHVTKVAVLDSDDKHIEGPAKKFAQHLVYEPEVENGHPVPFETVIYVEYYPFF